MVWYLLEDTRLIPFLLKHGPKVIGIETKSPSQKVEAESPKLEKGSQDSASAGSWGDPKEKAKSASRLAKTVKVSAGTGLTA